LTELLSNTDCHIFVVHSTYLNVRGRHASAVRCFTTAAGRRWCPRTTHRVTERSFVSGDLEHDETLPHSAGRHQTYSLWGK